jgi:Flp pilus assembly protein TadD
VPSVSGHVDEVEVMVPPPRHTPAAVVTRFEPKARASGPTTRPEFPAATNLPAAGHEAPGSQFLVAPPPSSELEHARRRLIEAWEKFEGEGLSADQTWAPMPSYPRAPLPPPAQRRAAASREVLPPAHSPPIFGGAALENVKLPPLPPNLVPKRVEEVPTPVPLDALAEAAELEAAGARPSSTPPPPPPDTTPPPGRLMAPVIAAPLGPPEPPPKPLVLGRISPPAKQLALPPYPGHGAPPRPSPQPRSQELEATFFGTEEQTPAVLTELPSTDPSAKITPAPAESGRLLWVVVAGLLVGGIGTALYLFGSQWGSSGTQTPPVVDEGGPDAGGAAVAFAPDLEDAGDELALLPVDAGAEVHDAGALALVAPKDAGAVAVMAARVDAGAVAKAAADAGASVAVATVDAGAKVAVTATDGGAKVAAVAANPGASPQVTAADFDAVLSDAKLQVQKQRWRSAMDAYRKALKLKPESGEAKTGLGISLVMSETGFKEAVPLLKDGVKDDPSNAQAWLALGMAYQNMGQDRSAKQPYMEYLKLKPKGATSDEIRAALEQMK